LRPSRVQMSVRWQIVSVRTATSMGQIVWPWF
jgi:hypothetical protein